MIEDCTLTGAVLFLLLENKARTAMWRACCCLRDGGVEAMSVAQVMASVDDLMTGGLVSHRLY